jgi:voltage-gated potassium channel
MARSMATHAEAARRRLAAIRFAVLGAALILTIASVMVLTPIARVHLLTQVLISVPLLAGLYTLSSDLRVAVVLGAAIALLGLLAMLFTVRGDTWLLIADMALRAALLAGVIGWLGIEVVRELHVSLDTILGGICIYLLLGFFYAHIYLMLVLADPGALVSGAHPLGAPSSESLLESAPAVVYYSYATLTTVAYGDITPAIPLARFVAISEAMLGQMFPTIFIARLVGMFVAQRAASSD